MAQIRHLTANMPRRFGACIMAVLVTALIVGFAGTHQHAAAGEAPVVAAAETIAAADSGDECPHKAHHQHHDAECCLGLGCAPALLLGASTLAVPGDQLIVSPLAGSTFLSGASGGQFRPPRILPAA